MSKLVVEMGRAILKADALSSDWDKFADDSLTIFFTKKKATAALEALCTAIGCTVETLEGIASGANAIVPVKLGITGELSELYYYGKGEFTHNTPLKDVQLNARQS